MISILFVCLHRPDRAPSQRFRFEQYISYLEKNGFTCKISFLLNEKEDKIFYSKGNIFRKTWIGIKSIFKRTIEIISNKHDIVFVQRECIMFGTSFFERMFAKKSKIVYDFDDSLWIKRTSPGNSAISFLKSAEKIKKIIKVADLVIAGNQFLADYALKYNAQVIIIPTSLDTNVFKPIVKQPSERICIGWSGSPSTIEHFECALNPLKKLKMTYGDKIYFKVIGDPDYRNKELDIIGISWNKSNELQMLSDIDIGIMPLPEDEWSNGKCGFKGLLYMSLAIPAVMASVGVNKDIITEGINGFLASNFEEWFKKLSKLIDSALLRQSIGEKGMETVHKYYSVDSNKDKLLNALKCLKNDSGL